MASRRGVCRDPDFKIAGILPFSPAIMPHEHPFVIVGVEPDEDERRAVEIRIALRRPGILIKVVTMPSKRIPGGEVFIRIRQDSRY